MMKLPVDPNCQCLTCRSYSRAYLRHLYDAGELSYFRLASLHNPAFHAQVDGGDKGKHKCRNLHETQR